MEIKLPPSIAWCPECDGDVLLKIDEWETATGIPTPVGCTYRCAQEDDVHYRMPYVDWLPREQVWYTWIVDHVRVQERRGQVEILVVNLSEAEVMHLLGTAIAPRLPGV
jgi:hypothetical protein